MEHLHLITEANKLTLNKPCDADRIYYSNLTAWHTRDAFRSFSIKYVVEGTIYYRCAKKEYGVLPRHFLMTPKQAGVSAYFDSAIPVKSICIDLCPASVEEAFSVLQTQETPDLDRYSAGYFEHPHFVEQIQHEENSLLGKRLQSLARALDRSVPATGLINEEWFLELLGLVISQEKRTWDCLTGIEARKPGTRKEIYQRLLQARQFMEAMYLQNPSITSIAAAAHLSRFHFFRSFRQAFHISPYQYMLELRLMQALRLMCRKSGSLTDIAGSCGFPDLFTFSKAFKRRYGISPRKYNGYLQIANHPISKSIIFREKGIDP